MTTGIDRTKMQYLRKAIIHHPNHQAHFGWWLRTQVRCIVVAAAAVEEEVHHIAAEELHCSHLAASFVVAVLHNLGRLPDTGVVCQHHSNQWEHGRALAEALEVLPIQHLDLVAPLPLVAAGS